MLRTSRSLRTVAPLLALLLALPLGLLAAPLRAQSGGHDLPEGLRSLAGLRLDRDSAASIIAKLGSTRERRVGAGDDAYAIWCFAVDNAGSRAILELMSDVSDMGTPRRELGAFRLRVPSAAADRGGCAPLHTAATLATPAGLRLGLTAARIHQLLGRPTRQSADSLIYEFQTKEYMVPGSPEYTTWNTPESRESCFDAGPPYSNVQARVIVLIRDGRAAEVRIERFDQAVC